MTVEKAIAEAKEIKKCHIIVDARDVLDLLDNIADMYEEEECIDGREHGSREILEFAKHEVCNMNIESPYRMKILNEMGDVEIYTPEEWGFDD